MSNSSSSTEGLPTTNADVVAVADGKADPVKTQPGTPAAPQRSKEDIVEAPKADNKEESKEENKEEAEDA